MSKGIAMKSGAKIRKAMKMSRLAMEMNSLETQRNVLELHGTDEIRCEMERCGWNNTVSYRNSIQYGNIVQEKSN